MAHVSGQNYAVSLCEIAKYVLLQVNTLKSVSGQWAAARTVGGKILSLPAVEFVTNRQRNGSICRSRRYDNA